MMKKIVPFNNVLNFSTDVKEITAISLEHEINKNPDIISGVFYITGEYKITDGQLEKEKFNFELPFDIALSNNYNTETLLVDIDDFRYEIISDKELKVNIDLYIDGEIIEPPLPREPIEEELPEIDIDIRTLEEEILSTIKEEPKEYKVVEEHILTKEENLNEEEISTIIEESERIDLLKDMLTNDKENTMTEEKNKNINNNTNTNETINNNIFTPNQDEEKYVTYRVYKVTETDTIDTIITKYNVTKELLSDYNNIENIIPGDKLIIPTNQTNEK